VASKVLLLSLRSALFVIMRKVTPGNFEAWLLPALDRISPVFIPGA
jgi:hypothetical protein